MDVPDRMTPSQFIASRAGSDAETICALLSDILTLRADNAAKDKEINDLKIRVDGLERDAAKPERADDPI